MRGRSSNPLLEEQLARGFLVIKARLPAEDTLTTQPGLADHTAQGAALVGRALVAEEHGARLNDPLGRVVEDANVRVEAHTQITLAGLQANLGSGVGTAEADHILQGVLGVLVVGGWGQSLATAEFGPEDGQTHANGGDTTPRGEEVACVFDCCTVGRAVSGHMRRK